MVITLFETVLLLNSIWFLMGFNVFSLRNHIFAKLLVPKEQRATPVFGILAASGRFLGGFNFAFAVCNLLILLNQNVFPDHEQRLILLFVFAIAHGSQFVFNVPIAIQNLKGKGVWQVKGTIKFIFVTDFALMLLNFVAAGIHLR